MSLPFWALLLWVWLLDALFFGASWNFSRELHLYTSASSQKSASLILHKHAGAAVVLWQPLSLRAKNQLLSLGNLSRKSNHPEFPGQILLWDGWSRSCLSYESPGPLQPRLKEMTRLRTRSPCKGSGHLCCSSGPNAPLSFWMCSKERESPCGCLGVQGLGSELSGWSGGG